MRKLLFIIASWISINTFSQLPTDVEIYGTWVKQGFEFNGSFYPTNAWNSESIHFKEDYSFNAFQTFLNGSKIDTATAKGKWSFNATSNALYFFSDEARYTNNDKIYRYASTAKISFKSDQYLVIDSLVNNRTLQIRFQKTTATESYESHRQRIASFKPHYTPKYDSNATHFFLVNSLDTTKKLKIDFSNSTFQYNKNEQFEDSTLSAEIRIQDFEVLDFTDSTLKGTLTYEKNILEFANESSNESYIYYTEPEKIVEFKNLKNITYQKSSKLDFLAPTLASTSVLTTLIIAPLISINYKTGDFNQKRYYKTALIGLIGIGTSIPIHYLFKTKSLRIIPRNGEVDKKHWYMEKVRVW